MVNKIRCIIVDDEPTAREILQIHIEKIVGLHLMATCKNALEAFSILQNEQIDLVFLDIHMPEVSGISLAKSIGKNTKVIFTTAFRDYAIDGFNLQAVDYLLKPISLERLLQSVQKYRNETLNQPLTVPEKDLEAHMFVRADRKMVKVRLKEIVYIESLSDYLKIFTIDEIIITREAISNIEAKLPSDQFFRIHRSFIVAMNYVSSYTKEFVELKDKQLPISRSYRTFVINLLERM
jgi:two-component system LytT family response regulator